MTGQRGENDMSLIPAVGLPCGSHATLLNPARATLLLPLLG